MHGQPGIVSTTAAEGSEDTTQYGILTQAHSHRQSDDEDSSDEWA